MRLLALFFTVVIAAPQALAQDSRHRHRPGVRRNHTHNSRRSVPTRRSYVRRHAHTRTYRAPTRTTRTPTYRRPTRTTRTPTYRAPTRTRTPGYRTPTRTRTTRTPTYRTPTRTTRAPGYQRPTRRGAPGYQRPTRTTRTTHAPGYQTPTRTRHTTATSAFRSVRRSTHAHSVNRASAVRSRLGFRSHHTRTVHHSRPRHQHSYYNHHGLHLSFLFGHGYYSGCGYSYPYYSYASRRHYAFFYPRPVTYCYAPYGFYYSSVPIYVTSKTYVRDDYATTDYEDVAVTENGPEDKAVEPEPAAGSPTTERFLREGSKAFHETRYEEAAKQFRLAAISTPDNAGALFALGQALLALGKDEYALRVIRKAIELNPALVKEPGDIVGVYKDQAEFDRVLRALENRAEAKANEAAPLLIGVQRYFTGDPRARADFAAAKKARPDDAMVDQFIKAVEERFKTEADLPPIK